MSDAFECNANGGFSNPCEKRRGQPAAMLAANCRPALWSGASWRGMLVPILATCSLLAAFVLASAFRFETWERVGLALPAAAFIATWTGGSFDTTMGFHHFGPGTWAFAAAFALAGIGVYQRRRWAGSLLESLCWIGLLEPGVRIVAICWMTSPCDSLGYTLDVQHAQAAIVFASLPCAMAIFSLRQTIVRNSVGDRSKRWLQLSLLEIALVTGVIGVLIDHIVQLSEVYGRT